MNWNLVSQTAGQQLPRSAQFYPRVPNETGKSRSLRSVLLLITTGPSDELNPVKETDKKPFRTDVGVWDRIERRGKKKRTHTPFVVCAA